ncbi:MAG TPA: pilus assembly protein PilN [Gammaproteobacteria bacterium]|nr:pilus assembly protein PilN [Gammaproteobacteria bacterium]
MAHINLLPWRETLRKEKQREFVTFLGLTTALGIVSILAIHMTVSGMIEQQQSRNNYLKTEIRQVDKRIKEIKTLDDTKQALLARMEIIQELQRSRPEIVHIFDELVTTLPNGLHLTSLSQSGNLLKITGRAESDARVSNYMRNLNASPWFKAPKLSVIQSRQGTGANTRMNIRNFSLEVTRETPESETGN